MELIYKTEKFETELLKDEDFFSLEINGKKMNLKASKSAQNDINIFDGDKKFSAYSAEDENHIYVNVDGRNFVLDKIKEEEKVFGVENGKSSDKDIVKPPMPGSIVKVLVKKEQKVADGEPLIIIESMKMETTLYSSIDGIVTEVNTSAGEQVDMDKVLVVVEKEIIQ